MRFLTSTFARPTVLVVLAALTAALPQVAAAQKNPLIGTWNFLPDKSTFMPGPARYKSLKLTITDPTVMDIEGEDTQGKPVKVTYNSVVDGKPHPITGMANYDQGSWDKINDNSTHYSYLKGKSIAVLGTRALSADGSTLTFREQVYDNKGKQLGTQVLVFRNPDVQVASAPPPPPPQPAGPPQMQLVSPTFTPDETAANEALAKGDDDMAIQLYTKVIDSGAKTQMLYYDHVSRGIAFVRKHDDQKALADFDQAVKLKPEDVDARFRRGGARVQLKDFQGAIEDFSAVIEKDPMNAQAFRLRGFSNNVLNKTSEAAADNDKACELDKSLCL
jgi:tetratricopeptide (TPR) repeat protein